MMVEQKGLRLVGKKGKHWERKKEFHSDYCWGEMTADQMEKQKEEKWVMMSGTMRESQ